jgi:glycosyltransferase involved in cell wall biosynthesis
MTASPTKRTSKYVIVSPVRDEEAYIDATIRCVILQTIQPVEWVIVDDGSSDRTAEIIDGHARACSWMRTVHRPDRGVRLPGTGVMEAFYEGFEALATKDWDFLVKLDGDVDLPADYFERCLDRFSRDSALGMCGGLMVHLSEGVRRPEAQPLLHVRGPIKMYRRACWDAIGGLIRAPGWDTVDEIQANRLGWRTRSFPELEVVHRRRTGAVQGAWRDAIKNGRADYVSGYHPVFMAAKCVRRLLSRPYLVVGFGQAWGYVSGYLVRLPRVPDRELIRYLRSQQLRRLLHGDSIWKAAERPESGHRATPTSGTTDPTQSL